MLQVEGGALQPLECLLVGVEDAQGLGGRKGRGVRRGGNGCREGQNV